MTMRKQAAPWRKSRERLNRKTSRGEFGRFCRPNPNGKRRREAGSTDFSGSRNDPGRNSPLPLRPECIASALIKCAKTQPLPAVLSAAATGRQSWRAWRPAGSGRQGRSSAQKSRAYNARREARILCSTFAATSKTKPATPVPAGSGTGDDWLVPRI